MPVRKNLRLPSFDYGQPGAYFITVCTDKRRNILSSVVGGDAHIAPCTKLTPIGRVVEKYLLSVPGLGAYVIMPNHVHMILYSSASRILEGPMWASAPTNNHVPSALRSWKTLVTKELGYSIWQRSYHDHIIRNEEDYNAILRYIQENPAKWCEDRYYNL